MISTPNLAKAIIAVMKDVKGIEKNITVGAGNNQYQGVTDKDVKKEIGEAMQKHGLCIMPIYIEPTMSVSRWEETSTYGGQPTTKSKQQVFTEVKTTYLLMHESGESVEVCGYGHGVDTQDKSAGKATTYAMKNTLLYLFMVPTGKIDDADQSHSEEQPVPPAPEDKRPPLPDKMFKQALERLKAKDAAVYDKTIRAFQLTPKQADDLLKAYQAIK